jgi:lipopolysaccharide export LptBFGC system permease protein LptF
MGKQSARQRSGQVEQQPQQQQQEPDNPDYDPVKAAHTKRLVLQTSAMAMMALLAAYLGLISDKLALAIMAGMCLCLRFFAFT